MVSTEGHVCPFLPSPRAAPVSLPRSEVGSQSKGHLSSPSNLLPDQPEGRPPSLEQAEVARKTKPIWKSQAPIRGTLLTY